MESKTVWISDEPFEFVCVGSGYFTAGSSMDQIDNIYADVKSIGIKRSWLMKEFPDHHVFVDEFWISRVVLPNRVHDNCRGVKPGSNRQLGKDWDRLPALFNNPEDVDAGLKLINANCSQKVRLPTEYEWEKAARGTHGQIYPWGDEFSADKANTKESGLGRLLPVDCLPEGVSPFGLLQCSGNVEEWTSTLYRPHPHGLEVSDKFGATSAYPVLKGGKYTSHRDLAHCARRHGPSEKTIAGLRLVLV